MSDERERSVSLDAASKHLDKAFEKYIILAVPKNNDKHISVAFTGSDPEVLQLVDQGAELLRKNLS
jgi:hypothetical protein